MSNKDWTGDSNSVYKTLGASNHCDEDREENDFYATDPQALIALLEKEKFNDKVWECAVGQGHLADVLKNNGYLVRCSDIIDRGYPNTKIIDFLQYDGKFFGDILTNPPYSKALHFVHKGMQILEENKRMIMFLKVQFLEGGKRGILFEKYPPEKIYVFCDRVECAKNGEFSGGSAVAYAWYIWKKGYDGPTIVDWIWKDKARHEKSISDFNKEIKNIV